MQYTPREKAASEWIKTADQWCSANAGAPGQPAHTLKERWAKGGVGELVTIVPNHVSFYR